MYSLFIDLLYYSPITLPAISLWSLNSLRCIDETQQPEKILKIYQATSNADVNLALYESYKIYTSMG